MQKFIDKFWKAVAYIAIGGTCVLTVMGLTGTVFSLRMLF